MKTRTSFIPTKDKGWGAQVSVPNCDDRYHITLEQFKTLYPKAQDPEGILESILLFGEPAGLFDKEKLAFFLAQVSHECASFTRFEENLNYSAKALNALFGNRLKNHGVYAKDIARQPEKIANVVYGGRYNNGPPESGDGWRYRGRGSVMITFKANYQDFEKDTGMDVVDNPDLILASTINKMSVAFWYWQKKKLYEIEDFKVLTKRINGGYNGLEDREKRLARINEVL